MASTDKNGIDGGDAKTKANDCLHIYRVSATVKLPAPSYDHFVVCEKSAEAARNRLPSGMKCPELLTLQTKAVRLMDKYLTRPYLWYFDESFMQYFYAAVKPQTLTTAFENCPGPERDQNHAHYYPTSYVMALKSFLSTDPIDMMNFPIDIFIDRYLTEWVPTLDLVEVEYIATMPADTKMCAGTIIAYNYRP